MYSTCIYCRSPLGSNETIEHFPVGRRLAFDAAKGRLWVVCLACRRWNLTPMEERWEAIEEAERAFRETRVRYSSDNIGLARVADGVELVRVGRALGQEFAAWRYGSRFVQRRKKYFVMGVGAAAAGFAVQFGAVGLGAPAIVVMLAPPVVRAALSPWRRGKGKDVVANLQAAGGETLAVRREDLGTLRVIPEKADRWGVTLFASGPEERVQLVDGAAIRVAQLALARFNEQGASQREVNSAVTLLESNPEPGALLRSVPKGTALFDLNLDKRLALEMAVNEDAERRALEGELRDLELAWKDAEEIASIADDMFLPASVREWLQRHT